MLQFVRRISRVLFFELFISQSRKQPTFRAGESGHAADIFVSNSPYDYFPVQLVQADLVPLLMPSLSRSRDGMVN